MDSSLINLNVSGCIIHGSWQRDSQGPPTVGFQTPSLRFILILHSISQAKSSGLYLSSVTHIRISHCALWKLLVLKCCADYYLKQVLWLNGEQPRRILIFFISHTLSKQRDRKIPSAKHYICSKLQVCLSWFICFNYSSHQFFHSNSHNHITDFQKDAWISCYFQRGNCKISAWHKFHKYRVLKILQIALNCWKAAGADGHLGPRRIINLDKEHQSYNMPPSIELRLFIYKHFYNGSEQI